MANILAILGLFTFTASKREFSSIKRVTNYKFAKVEKIANTTEYHPIGTQDQAITIVGGVNAIEGGKDPLLALRAMASLKLPYPLFVGDGDYLGLFIVENISENGTKIFINGDALDIGFSISLTRTDGQGLLSWLF